MKNTDTTTTQLTGSTKQIEWANDIRTRLTRWIDRAKSEISTDKHEAISAMFSKVLAQSEATFWINNINITQINAELTCKFSGGAAWEIKPGSWQSELAPIVAINKSL